MSDAPTPDAAQFRAWKKRLKPPRGVRRPLLYLLLAGAAAAVALEVIGAVGALLAGSAAGA